MPSEMIYFRLLHGFLFLVGVGMCIYISTQLANPIPIHFGISGEPDGFAPPTTVWALLVIWGFTAALMYWIGNHPELNTNVPSGLDADQLRRYNELTVKSLPKVNFFVGLLMLFVLGTIAYSGSTGKSIPTLVMWGVIGGTVVAILAVALKARKSARAAVGL